MDTAAAKIVIQRFDPRFTERNTTDSRHSFAGYEPAAAARSEERQRKAIADQSQGPPVLQGDARDMLPVDAIAGIDHVRTHRDNKGDTDAITGVGPVCPTSTPAIQAQSPCNAQEPAGQGHDDNDKTPPIEPETASGGAGGGL